MANKDPFKKAFKNVEDIVKEVSKPKNLQTIGNTAVDIVRKRIRLGYGCDASGKRTKLKGLKDSYKKVRKKGKGKLSKSTTPAKSNLTFTGKMLNSMRAYLGKPGEIVISFAKKYSLRKAQWVTENGRAFMGLTKQEQKRMTKEVSALIYTIIKKKNK